MYIAFKFLDPTTTRFFFLKKALGGLFAMLECGILFLFTLLPFFDSKLRCACSVGVLDLLFFFPDGAGCYLENCQLTLILNAGRYKRVPLLDSRLRHYHKIIGSEHCDD